MLRSPRQSDGHLRDSLTCNMDSSQPSTPQCTQALPQSASSSEMTSPVPSFSSKAHTARSGSTGSSIASSPVMRDSLDNFTPPKRFLTDVKEEPQEREDADMLDPDQRPLVCDTVPKSLWTPFEASTFNLPSAAHYDFNEYESTDEHMAVTPSPKKRRSVDSTAQAVASRIGTRFPSFSRKCKSKTGASPKLSIITDTGIVRSRTNSVPSQLASPALSVISKSESVLASSLALGVSEESLAVPFHAPSGAGQESAYWEEDQGQVTTPLLPPAMSGSCFQDPPLHSPLQSPTVAGTPSSPTSMTPDGTPQLPCLPSPPLSTKPSLASIRQRSRAGTLAPSSEFPPLSMLGQGERDLWATKLGHADFTISPKPYLPRILDVCAFKQFREDWDQAQHNYAKHLARTGEHYGTTSKTFLFTQEKWASIDAAWQQNDDALAISLGPLVAPSTAVETETSDITSSSGVLEQPATKVVVPTINNLSGKFPLLGDEDIVGPMTVIPSRARTAQQMVEPMVQTRLSKKRNFLKFISDLIGCGSGLRR